MTAIPVDSILAYLELPRQKISVSFLTAILNAWSTHIPWESASRIARHRRSGTPQDYARLPDAFFRDALALCTGGTCFESNLALRALLRTIGFDTTLAFCDMVNASTTDPHCAVIVPHQNALWLADAGYPVPAALELDSRKVTVAASSVYDWRATPIPADRWAVRRFSGEYDGLSFIVRAESIHEDRFRARLLRDHGPNGLFLKEVIVQKMKGDHMLRYSEGIGLVRRVRGREELITLSAEEQADLPATLAQLFGMDEDVLRVALEREVIHCPHNILRKSAL